MQSDYGDEQTSCLPASRARSFFVLVLYVAVAAAVSQAALSFYAAAGTRVVEGVPLDCSAWCDNGSWTTDLMWASGSISAALAATGFIWLVTLWTSRQVLFGVLTSGVCMGAVLVSVVPVVTAALLAHVRCTKTHLPSHCQAVAPHDGLWIRMLASSVIVLVMFIAAGIFGCRLPQQRPACCITEHDDAEEAQRPSTGGYRTDYYAQGLD